MIVTVLLLGLALIVGYVGSRRRLTQAHLLFVTLFFAAGVAMQVGNEALRAEPQTPEMHLNASLRHFQQQRYDDCIRDAREALRLKPDYAEAYNNLAAAYQSMHRWDEAITAAKEALRLKPDFPLARNNLNYALSQKAQTASAAAKPQKAVSNLPPTAAGRRASGART